MTTAPFLLQAAPCGSAFITKQLHCNIITVLRENTTKKMPIFVNAGFFCINAQTQMIYYLPKW
jgi:hypothetical protein